jgi:monoamine oxidase
MDEATSIERVLQDLEILFSRIFKNPNDKGLIRKSYTGRHFIQDWTATPSGGLALFKPYQFNLLKNLALGIDEKIFFAGEHLSFHHGWI